MGDRFQPPEFWSFKPFFTLQPVQETREKQLRMWKELILRYCAETSCFRIVPNSFPLFSNASIDRSLPLEGVREVVNYLIKEGNAEWEDEAKTTLMILWKSPEVLGNEIYQWACTVDNLGTVYTIYELHAGDEYQDSGFHGTDPALIRKALSYLESIRKCKIIKGETAEEDGVKFLAV